MIYFLFITNINNKNLYIANIKVHFFYYFVFYISRKLFIKLKKYSIYKKQKISQIIIFMKNIQI